MWVQEAGPFIAAKSVEAHVSEPIQRPTREVPMFATWFEPRTALSPEVESEIRSMCFTAEG